MHIALANNVAYITLINKELVIWLFMIVTSQETDRTTREIRCACL